MRRKLTTAEAAKAVGITRLTLQRWIRVGKISDPPQHTIRSGRAVRLWSAADVERLRDARAEIYHQGGGRPKRKKELRP